MRRFARTSMPMTQFLIIGGGIAGTTAAEWIRKANKDVSITIIEQEFHPLYSRVLLPHYIKGKVPRERVFLKKPEWYVDNNVELMGGVIATAIDTRNAFVTTSDGRELPYDKLLITTGGDLRTIEDNRRSVCYLRGVDDADQILQLLGEKPKQAAVYGGGFISLEFINIFDHFNIPMQVAMRGDGFWSRVLSDHSKQVMAARLADHGIEMETGVAESALDTQSDITGVGIGLDRSMTFVREAGIDVDRGILANEYLETNVPDVYTAGDVAQYNDTTVGRCMIAGNWMNAQMQGRTVAKTMLGERTEFKLVSSYATNLLGMEVVFVGDTSREHAEEVVQHLAQPDASIELFMRGGRTVGAILIGEVKQRQAITNAIKKNELYVG